jgi:hypothetical protein
MDDKNFFLRFGSYLSDIVHDIQNYTFTISMSSDSMGGYLKTSGKAPEDENNLRNFLRIIQNSNTRINDLAYFINAARIFFESRINFHDQKFNFLETTEEIIGNFKYKFAQINREVSFERGSITSEEITFDKEILKYLETILVKILFGEHTGHPIIVRIDNGEAGFVLDFFLKDTPLELKKETFSNSPDDFRSTDGSDAAFMKFIHFYVVSKVAQTYHGEFLASQKGKTYNGFKILLKLNGK